MEFDVERHERITAPIHLVWDEVSSLEQILAKSPQAFTYDIVPGGQRATAKGKLAWGPVKWTVDVDASIEDRRPPEYVRYAVEIPSLELRYEGSIELSMVGESETRLDYRGHMDVRHRMVGRMRGMFTELAEEHMVGIVSRVKVKSEQRRLAQERLLQ